MAKRRRHRKNRRQRRGRNLVYHLSSNTIQRYVEDEDAYEQRKAKQKEYRQKIEAMERDILSRAVFVTHALDLNKEGNLNRLRMVMEQSYGLVQKCEITSYNSSKKNNRNKRRSGPVDTTTRAPPARVIFHRAASAEKIFGGMSLLQAAQKNEAVEVKCSLVGYKGFFVVKPSQKFNGMVEDEITGSKEVNMPTQRFSMGYWFPAGEDACDIIPGLLDGQSLQNEWLEELTTDLQPTLKVDLENMLIILDFSHCNPTKNISSSNHRDLMSFLSDVLTETEEQCIVSFRFKDLVGSIEMCSISDVAGAVDLIFSLKQPPKLFSVRTDEIREYKTRMTELAGIQGTYFGRCLSYRLRITDTTMDKIFLNRKALDKLHRFGVLNAEIDSTMQAIPISLTKLPVNDREKVEAFLAETSANNMRLGLQMRAILDSAKCCWYHALNNSLNLQSGKQMNIFDLVNDGIPSLVEQVRQPLH